MKILIVSDTHGHSDKLEFIINKIKPIDMLIHLCDVEDGEYTLSRLVQCEIQVVSGNNDFFSNYDREKEITIGKYKAFITHGHRYYVNSGSEIIKEEGIRRGADIVMFGHTHVPLLEIDRNIVALNPGSLTYPRQEGRRPSYIIMEIDNSGQAHYTINYL